MTLLQRAQRLTNKYGTNDPQSILQEMGVVILSVPMSGIRGMYKRLKRNTFVFIDSELDERTRRFVLGHELGHHLYHRGQNRVFMDRHTLLIPSRQEIEADTFSVCLMQPHPDEVLFEGETTEQLAIRLGVDLRLVELYQTEIIRNRRRE